MNSFRRAMVLSVMWSTSVAAVEWTELSSSSDATSPRARHTMVVLDDGSAVMFGGNDEWYYMNDIFSLTVSGTTATWVQLSSVGDVPIRRQGHTMTVLHDGSAVMFGGECASVPRHSNDIYSLTVTGTIATWVQLSSAGDVPSMRADHTMVVLADGSAVMFGGFDYWNVLNDIYSLTVSGTTATWVQLSSVGDVPRRRQGHTVTVLHDGSAVMFGGYSGMYDGGLYYLNDNLNDDHTLTSTTLTSTIPTLPTAAAVKITLSITATAADEEEVCETTNLDRGGGTYGSFVAALAVATGGATFTLSCTDGWEDGFMLVTSILFTDGVTATTFSESVAESSADVASEFESQIATTFGVNVTATVSGMVLSVKAIDSATSACHIVLGWTLVAIFSLLPRSIAL